MSILIVSANPLFKEVIIATVGQIQTELTELSPEVALTRISELKPDVIIIDRTIPPPYFEDLLFEARNLQKSRTILLNPSQNEIILLDSYRETLRNVNDLIQAIGKFGLDIHSKIDD